MKKKYLVGLFFICLVCIVILIILIQIKQNRKSDLQKVQLEEKVVEMKNEEWETQVSEVDATSVENTPKPISGYYAKNMNGCVCIFEADGVSLFYESDISFEDLPSEVKKEIDGQGKYFSSELEVYYFLESYSS